MDTTTIAIAGGSSLLVVAAALLAFTVMKSGKKQTEKQVDQAALALAQARSRQKPNAGPSDANPVPDNVAKGSQVGAPLKDPGQGGRCKTVKTRANACGATGCSLLPSCPGFKKGVFEDRYQVGFIEKPTGITNKSKAITNGLDPQGILDIVNKLRATVGAPPVTWDDRLACAATAWAPMSMYDYCPHGAAPGFPYYPQVVGASASLTASPMQVAQEAIEELMWKQEKPLADSQKLTPVSSKLKDGWTRCGQIDPKSFSVGHYCVLADDSLRACGFGFGLNYTKSGYISSPQTVTPIIVGHFS